MIDDLRYSLPEPEAQPWLDRDRDKPLNRRSLLRKVATGAAVGAGFEVLWHRTAAAQVLKEPGEKGWGAVRGRIVWPAEEIPLPKPREIELSKYGLSVPDLKWFTSKGPVFAEDWVVNPKSLGIRFVFVWLLPASTAASARLPIHPKLEKPLEETVTMEQPCSGFAPHALAIRQGQKLLVTNESPVLHAFQWNGLNQNGNIAMPPGSQFTVGDLVSSRQPLKVSCAPHPWEGAWLRVFDHPYFTVTDADGQFEIRDAPEGDHRIVVWHETAGWLGGTNGRNGVKLTINERSAVDLGKIGLKPRSA